MAWAPLAERSPNSAGPAGSPSSRRSTPAGRARELVAVRPTDGLGGSRRQIFRVKLRTASGAKIAITTRAAQQRPADLGW